MPFKGLSHKMTSQEDHLLEIVIHKLQKVELNVYIYNESSYFEEKCSNITDLLSAMENHDSTKCVWIEVIGPIEQRNDLAQQLAIHFNLPLLTLKDIQSNEEKMKLEIYDDGIYLLMKMIYIHEHNHTNIQQQQISFYVQDNILITFQEKHTPFFLPIKHRLANSRGKLTKLRSDYLFYCLLDIIVENYMIVLDLIGHKIEHIEIELMQVKTLKLDTLKLIYNVKHDMLHFRIMCSPLKDITIKLQKAHDRVPRRDTFAAQRRGPKPLKKKRGRRVTRRASVGILQPTKPRGRSVSPIRTPLLQPIRPRGRSLSSPRSNIVRSRKSRQTFSNNDVTVLHEYIFTYLKGLHVHILEMNGTIETYSEMISWLVNFYMALNENTVQQAVRLLAMLQAVHYPLMCVHGLNSMNFDWVPQRDDYYNSYFIFLAIMVLIVLTGLTTFKIKKWF